MPIFVLPEGVVDIYDAAGIKKPDISILSEDFLNEFRKMKRKNLAVEVLRKLLLGKIRGQGKKNMMQEKKFSEMLNNAINKYHSKVLTAAEIIEELIKLAREMRKEGDRGKNLNLTEDEIAFYDALEANDSAVKVLGDDTLKEIARVLVEKVKGSTSIDWTIRESVRAKLKVIVRRTLRKYGYPPDKQKMAVDRILRQSELFAEDWVSKEQQANNDCR